MFRSSSIYAGGFALITAGATVAGAALSDEPALAFGGGLIVAGLWVLVWASCRRSEEKRVERRREKEQWSSEADDYSAVVAEWSRQLDAVFRRFAADNPAWTGGEKDWNVFVARSDWPEPLPMPSKRPLRQWVDDYADSLDEDSRIVLNFAQEVFPPYDPKAERRDKRSLVGADHFYGFESNWRAIKSHLNEWGDRAKDREDFAEWVDEEVGRFHLNIPKIVAYLQIAHSASLAPISAEGPRDIGLFYIGRHWNEKYGDKLTVEKQWGDDE